MRTFAIIFTSLFVVFFQNCGPSFKSSHILSSSESLATPGAAATPPTITPPVTPPISITPVTGAGKKVSMVLLYGDSDTVSMSCDGGESWPYHNFDPNHLNDGDSLASITSVQYDNGIMYMMRGWGGVPTQLSKSTDGKTWTALNQLGPFLSGMLVSGNIIVTADGGAYNRSTDSGATFTRGDFFGSRHLHSLVYDRNGKKMFMVGDNSISASYDSGLTWQKSYGGVEASQNCAGLMLYNGSGILLSLGQQGAVCKSVDDGVSWQATVVLNGFFENHKLIWTGTKFMAYAGNQDTVFESADGVTWAPKKLIGFFPFGQSMIFRNATSGIFYAYKYANTFARSLDGISWTDLPPSKQPPTSGGNEFMQNLAMGEVTIQPGHPCY